MNKTQAWVGKCHLRDSKNADDENLAHYECYAACWTTSREEFEGAVSNHVETSGKLLLWTEETLPINNWLHRHGHHQQVMALAKSVHANQKINLGALFALKLHDAGIAEASNADEEQQDYLVVEEIENVEPLDAQMEVWPLKNVPDVLLEPLFGQPEPTAAEISQYDSVEDVPTMKTYVIIDAAKFQWGFSEIEDCGLPFQCLFKGNAAAELKDVAPYIIELDAKSSFTRRLFSYKPEFPDKMTTVHLWQKEPGIYIRSRASMEEISQHFRKFTKIQEDSGKWYFFRFYEPRVMHDYLSQIQSWKERIIHLFNLHQSAVIYSITTIHKSEVIDASEPGIAEASAESVSADVLVNRYFPADEAIKYANENPQIPTLGQKDINILTNDVLQHRVDEILQYLYKVFASQGLKPEPTHHDTAYATAKRMSSYGLKNRRMLTTLIAWSLLIHPEFETQDEDNKIIDILKDKSLNRREKFEALSARMDVLNEEEIA